MKEIGDIIPQQWAQPCGNQCTQKYAALTQIPWRVFCKKGCGADGDTWDECVSACDQICYKDPVLKDQQWSAYIDRSPGATTYSEECFHACVAGCGFKVSSLPYVEYPTRALATRCLSENTAFILTDFIRPKF
ncbi:hypothetical protein RND81_07G145500 [Saponaria officinalis]|uniref:Uncharacterized protein n=1 Tax=Saponaria officinalis TaxID=3572 RepID=A0AAW1JRZ1_SAPOF